MAIVSKYSTQQIENILNELLEVLNKHDASTELGLMVLGNAATHIINSKVAPEQREHIAQQFGKVLVSSMQSEKPH
ncbi:MULTISPECIES: DUF1414 domain-containing protein [Aliagarivorans]|uniref:DUF1414 domain-containing protein n=1 Tax=Aliagarivorans TaxID=882379 RepID=UPI0003F83069|nr:MULTISPECIES: DUF1414 domain-containing protein [Aliagarivorans]